MPAAALAGLLMMTIAPPSGGATTTTKPPKTPAGAGKGAGTTTTTSAEMARRSASAQEIKTLREQVAEASAEEAELLDVVDEAAGRRRKLDERLGVLNNQIASAEEELEAAAQRLADIRESQERAEERLAVTTEDLARARQDLVDRAVSAYLRVPSAQAVNVLFDSRSLREVAAAQDYLQLVVQAQARSVQRYNQLRERFESERRALVLAEDEARAQRLEVARRHSQLLETRSVQGGLRNEAAAEERHQKSLLNEVRSRVRQFEAQIAALRRESDAVATLLRAAQQGQKVVPAARGTLAAPVPGAVTSTFGPRPHPLFRTVRMHTGVDMQAASGTPVRASADAAVVAAGNRGGYGRTVILDHSDSLGTLYAHLSRISVSQGQRVSRGTVVGYAGSSGFATSPHLHFEVRVVGNPVDPLRYL